VRLSAPIDRPLGAPWRGYQLSHFPFDTTIHRGFVLRSDRFKEGSLIRHGRFFLE
jgi:hypothetical protein